VNPPTTPLLRLLPLLWLVALLAGLLAIQSIRRAPQLRRYAALVPLALLLVTGAVIAGCAGAKSGTPAGPANLTITATSGTMSQMTNVTLTVN
jgi:formate hydrogenlyase subunit 4